MQNWIKKNRYYLLVFLVAECVLALVIFRIFGKEREEYFQGKVEDLEIAYSAITKSYGLITRTVYNEIINKSDVTRLLREGWQEDSAARDRTRNELYTLLSPSYENLRLTSFVQLHFLLPDNTSFLRFHKPERYGDDLTASRPSIVQANEEKRPVEGFEIGRCYHGYRYSYPLFKGNEHVGTVEIGVTFNAIKSEMEKVFQKPFIFLLDKATVESNLFTEELDRFAECSVCPDFLVEEVAGPFRKAPGIPDPLVIEDINHARASELYRILALRKPGAVSARLGGHDYVVTLAPIMSNSQQKIAYLISYEWDLSFQRFRNSFIQTLVFLSILVITLILLAYYAIQHYRIIKHKRDQLISVMNNIADGLLILDLKHRIQTINSSTEKILGHYEHEIVGRELDHIIGFRNTKGEIVPSEKWTLFSEADYGLTYHSNTGFFISRGSLEVPVEVTGSPRYHGAGLAGYLIVFRLKPAPGPE